MKRKKWMLPVGILVGVIVFCMVALFAAAGIMSAKGYGVSLGRFYLSNTGCYLVGEGKAMFMSDQSDDKNLFDGLDIGDLILVIHDGVDESYPSRTGAHRIFRLRKGNERDLPENLNIGIVELDRTADIMDASPIDFDVQYIRTNGYKEDVRYPVVRIVRSVQELNAYYEENREKYDLEHRDKIYSDTTMGFLDACDKYDETYFENHILVMVVLEEGSGSNRHTVQSVRISSGGKCYIFIDTIVPEVGTDDMAQWHILIEPETGVAIEKESDIIVLVDGLRN